MNCIGTFHGKQRGQHSVGRHAISMISEEAHLQSVGSQIAKHSLRQGISN